MNTLDNNAACSHSRVILKHVTHPQGTVSDYWECDSGCGKRFVPTAATAPTDDPVLAATSHKTEPAPVDCDCPPQWQGHQSDCLSWRPFAAQPDTPKPAETRITWERTGEYRPPLNEEFYEGTDGQPMKYYYGTLIYGAKWILRMIESPSAPCPLKMRRED